MGVSIKGEVMMSIFYLFSMILRKTSYRCSSMIPKLHPTDFTHNVPIYSYDKNLTFK